MAPLLADAIETSLNEHASHYAQASQCLDVGCGEQPLRTKLESMGFAYSSLDLEQNSAAGVEHIGTIDKALPLTLQASGFDLIVCTEVLEHVANWPIAFANLTTLLKAGGRLLITCPHIWVPHEEPHDYFRPTSWALDHFAKQNELNIVSLKRLGDGYDVLGTVLAAVRITAPRKQPWMWLIAGPLSLIRKLALAILSLRPVRHVLNLPTRLYLSTVAVLEKSR